MAKAPKARKQSASRKSGRVASAKARPAAVSRAAKPGGRKAPAARTARSKGDDAAVTRVTHETEVRGTETRVERVVERAPKPSLPVVDRAAGRGRYVYCIIRASQPMKFGAIGMDEQGPDVYTVNFKDMAAAISDHPLAPPHSPR